jgi:NTE family protein
VNRVGLVLGGGGITGAAYEMAALMAIELATGWDPDDAEVIIGTSAGAFSTALVRSGSLHLDSLVRPGDDRQDVADRIRRHVFTKDPGGGVGKWMRYGIGPGIRRPGVTLFMGSPARYSASGLGEWVSSQIGPDAAGGWPSPPTAIVAFDLRTRTRTAFGTVDAPDVTLSEAVAASSAIPIMFRPYELADTLYVDGGVASGTHADLVLGLERPLDLVLVLAPMAAETQRRRAMFHEKMFDRVGQQSLQEEIGLIKTAWPDCDVIVLSPSPSVQNAMRPNPMDPTRAVATFMRTLISMSHRLAEPEIWDRLSAHLAPSQPSERVGAV